MIHEEREIPVVCGHTLNSETNIIRRGASTLLNARLLSVIEEFLRAVETALSQRRITAPVVIVRSDGNLMNTAFTGGHPVETLLSGPVASVMGAVELAQEQNALIVDMGGTTTDIAFVKNAVPQRVKTGIRIGGWNTFVKGLFVDTFGLGGDSGIRVSADKQLCLEEKKTMPLCMAAAKYPTLKKHLAREAQSGSRRAGPQKGGRRSRASRCGCRNADDFAPRRRKNGGHGIRRCLSRMPHSGNCFGNAAADRRGIGGTICI